MQFDNTATKYPFIRLEMIKKGITILELSKLMGMSYNTLRKKLDGTSRFYLDEAKLLSSILEASVEQLFEKVS